MSDRNLRALDMRHTLPNLKNLLLTLSDEEGAQSSPAGWNAVSSLQLSYIKSGTSLWTPSPSHLWYPTLLNVRTMRCYSCDDRWKIKPTMMVVSSLLGPIQQQRVFKILFSFSGRYRKSRNFCRVKTGKILLPMGPSNIYNDIWYCKL